jgi:predicted nuclease of restriction endonuclease-like (RecB) superfamily
MARKPNKLARIRNQAPIRYVSVLGQVVELLNASRRTAARAVNGIMTATYWEVGRTIVEFEQHGADRAKYGDKLIERLSKDLTSQLGRGFSQRNLEQMRMFYLGWSKAQTVSAQFAHTVERGVQGPRTGKLEKAAPTADSPRFSLPWSHYVRLLSIEDTDQRSFYETESLRGGWSVRQLDRQINSQFYQRALLSKNKPAMLAKGQRAKPADGMRPDEEIKDPLVLEFLNLKDEYSERDLEESLIRHLESFLMELGGDFAFIGRQRRLRVGDHWFRIDLLLFHRRLRSLVIIDLKLTEFSPADVGQMNLYLNYAREHWTNEDENPPVGLILCAAKDSQVAQYAMDGLAADVRAAEYRTKLPSEQLLVKELRKAQATAN